MNKILWSIVLVFVAWTCKLTMDVYTWREQKMRLNENLEQQNQRIGKLYDQLVALQSQRIETTTATPTPVQPLTQTYSAQHYVQDRVQLIQMLLQQQYFVEALEQIQLFKQQLLEQAILSSSLNQALIEALAKDQTAIAVYVQQRGEHVQILQQQLQQIERALQRKPLAQVENKWQFSTWLRIGKAEQIPDFYQRTLYFKQLQLQILVAQQALYAGQIAFYQVQLQEIVEGLSRYPDHTARVIVTNIQQLDTRALSTPPQLSALALVQE